VPTHGLDRQEDSPRVAPAGECRRSRGRPRELVFPAPSGGYDDAKRLLEHEHRPALERAGLRTSIVTHELRHTAAAAWLSLGFALEYVRRQMGHRDIATTIRNYGHLERTLIPDAAARTEAAVLGDSGSTRRLKRSPEKCERPA
jgi:integrase